jgi:hypothetical protein
VPVFNEYSEPIGEAINTSPAPPPPPKRLYPPDPPPPIIRKVTLPDKFLSTLIDPDALEPVELHFKINIVYPPGTAAPTVLLLLFTYTVCCERLLVEEKVNCIKFVLTVNTDVYNLKTLPLFTLIS